MRWSSVTTVGPRLFLVVPAFGHVILDGVDDRRVEQRRDVAQRPVVGDVAQEPAHDLAAAGLGQLGRQNDLARLGERADFGRVVVSAAPSRKTRRMILPLGVLGSSGVKRIWRGLAIGPISCATWSRNSATSR